jgi:hypothetical protein
MASCHTICGRGLTHRHGVRLPAARSVDCPLRRDAERDGRRGGPVTDLAQHNPDGLGGFESCFHRFDRSAPNFRVDFAHNDYLQLFAELGLAGCLPLLFLAALAMMATVRRAIGRAGEDSGLVALACAGSLTAIAIHSVADFNLYIPAKALALSWIGGIALRPRSC